MSEEIKNTTPTKKVVDFDAVDTVAPVQSEITSTTIEQVLEQKVDEPVVEEKKDDVKPQEIETPVVTPVEKVGEAIKAAEIDNADPVVPVAPFPIPEEPKKEQAPTQEKSESPKVVAQPEPGTDELLEELRTPSKPEDAADTDDDQTDMVFNQVVLGDRSDVIEDMRKFYPTDQAVKKAVDDESSLFNAVTSASVNGWHTGDNNSYEGPLGEIENVSEKLIQQSSLTAEKLADGVPSKIKHHDVRMNGKQARMLLQARLGGLRRINLLNSGFWVLLRAPKLNELQEIFTSIDLEGKDIGRTIGTHFALISDLFLKKKFVEALIRHKLIQESNFVGINEPGAFLRNLSFHDYETLVHGVVSLMTRNGLRMRMVCPKCGEISVEQHMDISAAKFVNRDLETEQFRQWWSVTVNEKGEAITRTEGDLKRYREEILGYKHIIRQEVETGIDKAIIELELATPVMSQFFRVGEFLINQLNETISSITEGDQDKTDLVKAALAIHGFQLLAPWIKEMRLYQSDGKTLDLVTTDHQVIIEYLDQTIQQSLDNDMFKELDTFVAKTRMNYFGSCSIECPKCHAKPESNLDNFFALDVQMIFFGLLFRRSAAGSSPRK